MKANKLILTMLTLFMVACTSPIEPVATSDNSVKLSEKERSADPIPTAIPLPLNEMPKEITEITEITMTTLEGTAWHLPNLGSDNDNVKIAPFKERITLEFADGSVSGSAGCNRYFASYTHADDGTLTFSPIGSTRRACEKSLMSAEAEFLQALQATTRFTISEDGAQLTLILGEKGALTFALNS